MLPSLLIGIKSAITDRDMFGTTKSPSRFFLLSLASVSTVRKLLDQHNIGMA